MRLLLCCAAVAAALGIAGCGGSSSSSSTTRTQAARTSRPTAVVHYINRYPMPKAPGAHPGARVERLLVRDIRRGNGPAIHAGDTGQFEFILWDWNTGRQLEKSWYKLHPYEVRLEHNVVIDGWWQGLAGMRVGGMRRILVPPSLGFTMDPELASHAMLFYVVLVQVNPEQPPGVNGNSNRASLSSSAK